jgi:hypothetical protein
VNRIGELEAEIGRLTEEEYGELRRWFLNRDWKIWDRQIEEDSASGRLDFLVSEARDAKASGTLRDL